MILVILCDSLNIYGRKTLKKAIPMPHGREIDVPQLQQIIFPTLQFS
jgi:hypothetical protein